MHEASVLSIGREALIDVSAAIACRRAESLERTLRIAGRVADPTEVDEVILQAHLFVGFPLTLEALILWRRLRPNHTPPEGALDGHEWEERGERVCRTVYATNYDKLRTNVTALHPDLDRWMVVGGYGRVLGRPELDLATRELCIVALLAVWDTPRQFHSHVKGALHAGASRRELDAAIEVACRHLNRSRADAVRALAARIHAQSARSGAT